MNPVRAHLGTQLPALIRRALPTYGMLGLVAAVLFSPQGIRCVDVLRLMSNHPVARVLLWLGWLGLSLPAVRVALASPRTLLLRSLPVSLPRLLLAPGLMLLLCEAPWLALHARGGGVVVGLAALAGAAALHTAWLARGWLGLAAALLGSTPLWLEPLLGAPLAGLGAVLGLAAAWWRAPELRQRAWWPLVRGPAPLALATAYLTHHLRGRSGLLGRGLLVMALGGALAAVVARAQDEPSATVVLGVLAPFVVLAATSAGWATALAERRQRALLDSLAVGRPLEVSALVLSVIVVVLPLTVLAAAASLWTTALSPLPLLLQAALLGLGVAGLSAVSSRWSLQGSPKDGDRQLVCALGLAILGPVVVGILGAAGPAVLLLAALVGVGASALGLDRLPAARTGDEGTP